MAGDTIKIPAASWSMFLLGAALIWWSSALKSLPVPQHWLFFPVGLAPGVAVSADYYPLIPWFGVFLWGNGIGKWLYKSKQSLFGIEPQNPMLSILSKLGRRTLLIYLLHQPVIIGIITLWQRLIE